MLTDQGSSVNFLYWDAFEIILLDLYDLKDFQGSLVGFSDRKIQVKDYITLKTMFRVDKSKKLIKVISFIIYEPSCIT